MRQRYGVALYFCAGLFLVLASGAAFAQGQKSTHDTREANQTERDNPRARAQWFLRGRTVNGKPAPDLLHKAYQQKLNNRRLHEAAKRSQTQSATQVTNAGAPTPQTVNPNTVATIGGPGWVALGPAPSGTASVGDPDQDYGPAIGRVTVTVVDQSDSSGNTIYIGGAAGGLWKSTNAASTNVQSCSTVSVSGAPFCAPNVTWTPLLDQQATLTVGAMAIRPGNPQWLVVGTGEANNSADSYYGLGFLVSQDGGASWTAVSTAKSADGSSTIDLHGLGVTKLAFSADSPATVVATMAATSGGIDVGAEFAGSTARGIYFSKDAGLTWQRANVSDNGTTPDAGSANSVIYNPFTHLFYANIRYHGFYSSADGQNWTRLATQPSALFSLANCPSTPFSAGCSLYRAEMTVVPGRAGPSNQGEMYVFVVDSSEVNQGIYETTNGGASWTSISTAGMANCGDGGNGACGTDQGSYNMTLLAVPNGSATDLYAGAVNQYRCTITSINPTCAATPFANLTHTYGNCGTGNFGAFAHVHPDQHGIDFVQSNPDILYFGNDGGIYRTLRSQTGTPSTQICNSTSQPWIQFDNLSGTMGSMIQFVGFSQSPSDSSVLLGGTQDNGTMAKNSSSTPTTFGTSFQSVNNGDGGFTDINPVSPQEWFVSNPNLSILQCINGSGITCTANTFNSIVTSSKLGGDSGPFYTDYMLDPQAGNHLLVGTCRLWRVDRNSNLATTWPGTAALTFNLDAFSAGGTFACSASAANQITAIGAGGPCKGVCNSGTNGAGNGSQVIYIGTDAGKVFVTTSADAGTSSWADRSSGLANTTGCAGTGCPISGIALDPADTSGNTAYVTVMGFKTGHVFKTTNAGATWTNIDGSASGTGLPDNPADSVVVDPNTKGVVYVGTDVGVFVSHTDPADPAVAVGSWKDVGPTSGSGSLPNVVTTALHIFGTGANTKLRVGTYGRGLWEISIAPVPTFTISVTSPAAVATGQSSQINGTIQLINSYSNAIQVSCTNLPASLTCTPSQQTLPGGTTTFSIAISGTTPGTYPVIIRAVGTDAQAHTEQQTVSFTVLPPPDFSVGAASAVTTFAGRSDTTTFLVNANATFTGNVTATCTTKPANWTCSSPLPVALSPNGAASINISVTPDGAAAVGNYSVTVTVTSGSISHTTTASVQVLEYPDFTMGQPTPPAVSAGLTSTSTFDVTANSTFNSTLSSNGLITFDCPTVPSGITCSFTPASVSLNPGQTRTITLNLQTSAGTPPNTYNATVRSTPDVGSAHSRQVSLTVQAATNSFEVADVIQFSAPSAKVGQVLTGATVAVRSSAYSGTVNLTCSGGSACTVVPSTVSVTAGGSKTVNISFNTFGKPVGNGSLTITGVDSLNPAKTATSASIAYSITDYTVSAGTTVPILPGGSTPVNLTLTPLNGFVGSVSATCTVTPIAGLTAPTCTLPVGPFSVTGAAATQITATISGPGNSNVTGSQNWTVTVAAADTDNSYTKPAHNASFTATVQDYKLQTANTAGTQTTTATVTAGQSATFVVSVVPQAGGFSGTVNFDAATICSGLPSKASCSISATSAAAGGSVNVTISTTAATLGQVRPTSGAPLFAFWTMLPGALGIVMISGKRRKRTMWAGLALIVVLLVAMSACGGGGGGSTTKPPSTPIPGTPAGVSTVTITSTSGAGATAITRTAQVTLTVQ